MSRRGLGIRERAWIVFGIASCLCSVEATAEAVLSTEIPAQPLASALTQFSYQTGLQFVYVSDVIQDQQSEGAPAGLSITETLNALLAGTGLTFEFLNQRAVRAFPANARSRQPEGHRETTEAQDAQSLDTVVVTASPLSVRKLDASYTVVVANLEQIKQANPTSTADLMKIAPGVWTESTGGQTGANIEVAGFPGENDSPFFTLQMNGSPLFGAPFSTFVAPSTAFRIDDTIERVEVVQGGPSVLFADGQVGATANFILRRGTPQPTGSIGFTYGSEQLKRLDAFSGFEITPGWYGSFGGFYRESRGVRAPRDFPADVGGQFTATLSHDWSNGSILFYARTLDDKNQFVSAMPLLQRSQDHFSAYPGFDPLTGTYDGNAIRHVNLPNYLGGTSSADLANGRGADMRFFGGNLDLWAGDWTISDRWLVDDGDLDINAIFPNCICNRPAALADEISSTPAPGGYPIPTGALVSANYVGGGSVDPRQDVIHQGWWFVQQHHFTVSNELQLSRRLFEQNTLTAGLYATHFTEKGTYSIGNEMLMSDTPHARPITVSYVSGGLTYHLTDPQGFIDLNNSLNLIDHGTATNLALYLSDSWRLDRWLLDAGVRVAQAKLKTRVCNVSPIDLDHNPLDLYNKSVLICDGTFHTVDYDPTRTSWTAGLSRDLSSQLSAYGRVHHGVHFLSFTDVEFATTGQTPPEQTIEGYEVGLKYQAPWIYADLTAYRRTFSGIPYGPTDAMGSPLPVPPLVYGADSKGVDAIVVLTPVEPLKLELVGSYMHGVYAHFDACIAVTGAGCAAIDGRALQHQPIWHVRVTPSYLLPFHWGALTAFLTYTYVGEHWEDVAGLQPLGTFNTLDFGVIAAVGKNWELRIQGTNVTNELGLTQGDPAIGAVSSGSSVIEGRSLEGREVNIGLKYRF
jgi:hypothetical protein